MPQVRPRSHRRPGPRLWPLLIVVPLLLLLAGAGYALKPLTHPLPSPTVTPVLPAAYRIPGNPPALPMPGAGQAVIDVEEIGRLGAAGAANPVPIASVAKIMTAYVILTAHPLGAEEGGPAITVTAAQANAYARQAAAGESLVKVAAGAAFTERQALQAVMLPSANNMARILAEWDAGSIAAFVAKMNATAASLGMAATHYTDPAGLDPGTVSTAPDQVTLARKAMALPAFANIVALTKADLPVAGTVENYNTLLGQDGVVGVKTGSTEQAGGCFVFAARLQVQGRALTVIGAVFGQPGADTPQQLDAAFAVTKALIRAAGQAIGVHTVVRAGQLVARFDGPLDTGTTMIAEKDAVVLGWPGLDVTIETGLPSAVPRQVSTNAEFGKVVVRAGKAGNEASVVVRAAGEVRQPGNWTRIKRHR